MMPTSIFIVEDRALARRMLERQLTHAGRSCLVFNDAAQFQKAAPTLGAGIVLLDIHMPGKSGLDLLDELGPLDGPFAVVVISGSTAVDDAIGAFRRGAIHFLRKPYRLADLEVALREAAEALDGKVRARARLEEAAKVRLTTREMQVIKGIAQGLQSKAIAFELGISIRTVELHRSRLMAKLKAQSASHALAIAQKLGLLTTV